MDNAYHAIETEISERYKTAEFILEASEIVFARLVRNYQVIGLQVYGNTFYDLQQVERILGNAYHCSLNPNNLSITII